MMSSPSIPPVIDVIVDGETKAADTISEKRMENVNILTWSDMEEVRMNITGNENVADLRKKEKMSIRLSITLTYAKVDGVDKVVPTQLSSILNCFEIGSMRQYKDQIDGIMKISFNVFKVTFCTETFATVFLERFPRPTTGYGNDEDDVFEFTVDSFMGKIESLTLYPIPVETGEMELCEFMQENWKIGKIESFTWGRHKNHKQWKNGFVHVKVRELNPDTPDRMKINGRPVTILREGQKLHRPCTAHTAG